MGLNLNASSILVARSKCHDINDLDIYEAARNIKVGTPSRNMPLVVCCCIRTFLCTYLRLGKFVIVGSAQALPP
jgi:hypothetical protein